MTPDRPTADVAAANALNGAIFVVFGVAAALLGLWGLVHAGQMALRPLWSDALRDLLMATAFLGAGVRLTLVGVRVFRTGRS